jgi:hypothetical protein
MKCLAEEALRGKREHDRGAEYGLVCLEFIDVSVSRQMMRQHGWRRVRLQRMYDEERHYLSDYIGRYAADGGVVKDRHKGFRSLTEGEIMSNAIEATQEKIDRELEAIGFVYDPDELVPKGSRNTWRRKDLAKSAKRMMWYAQYGGRAARLYLTCLLMYLHDNCGFGKDRLRRLYDPVAADLRWYTQKFFVGTDACDAEIKKRIDDAHAEIESCGVELVQVTATGAMEVRKKEAEKPVEIPPELAGLDWETLINQQYEMGGLRGKL